MDFISPSKGSMTLQQVFEDILQFIGTDAESRYKLIIGSDSHVREETIFVTAVVIHHVGKGARYYYSKKIHRKINSLRQKIFFETSLSLQTASTLVEMLSESGHEDLDVEIHLDIGPNGSTRELIKDIVGMVVGSGFDAKIKPDSCGASTVADKYTK